MAVKKVSLTIRGLSAILMHKFPLVATEALEKKSPAEQAELAAYRMDGPKSNLYLSGLNFQRALVSAATFSKGKGRGSLQKQVAACVMVSPEYGDLGTSAYEIDSRPVVVPATKGRVLRHRPRIDKWECSFDVEFDDVLLKESELRRVVDDCGSRVGVLDFRPEHKGPFGRFMVTNWKML